MNQTRTRPRGILLAACIAAGLATTAQAMGTNDDRASQPHAQAAITKRQTGIDASGDYAREMQACRSGRSHQVAGACMEEARNARAARRQGKLELAGEDYRANALARCRPFTGEDRAACDARVMGFGDTSGTVAGGGLLRQVETVTMPPGQDQATFVPRTDEPVVVPMPRR